MKINNSFKWLALALALMMVLSLFACGDKNKDEDQAPATAETQNNAAGNGGNNDGKETEGETPTSGETGDEGTDAPIVKCKHDNEDISPEHGCVIWCPDCETATSKKAYHKNQLKYIDNEGYYTVCSACGEKKGGNCRGK